MYSKVQISWLDRQVFPSYLLTGGPGVQISAYLAKERVRKIGSYWLSVVLGLHTK